MSLVPGLSARRRATSRRLTLSCVHTVLAGDVADDRGKTGKRRKRRSVGGQTRLHAAVDGVSRADLVNAAGVDRHDRSAANVLPGDPERLDVGSERSWDFGAG